MPICTVAVTCARTKVEQKEIRSNRYQTLPLVEKICDIFCCYRLCLTPLYQLSTFASFDNSGRRHFAVVVACHVYFTGRRSSLLCNDMDDRRKLVDI